MFASTLRTLVAAISLLSLVEAHTVITYPGWRGDNLITNDTFPYGMQWMYPCGGMPTTTNRTIWPTTGGAIAIQPGWFQGHATAFFYINMGFGTSGPTGGPPNMSFPMVPVFQIVGPTKNPYPGAFCLPQVPLPANITVQPGDLATIQVVEAAVHGASLFSCVDIIFATPEEVFATMPVNETNCANSSDISFNNVFSISTTGSASSRAVSWASVVSVAGLAAWALL